MTLAATVRFVGLGMLCAMALRVSAQFYGNAVPAELLDLQAGNVWFGSVRDESGEFLGDATVLLDSGMIEYVAVTEIDGRFRLILPEATRIDEVTPSCARPGFNAFALRLRPPAMQTQSPVEVTCVLRRTHAP